jgi:hypothetical protein
MNETQTYEVTVSGTGIYRTTVTATSPEEAIRLAESDTGWYLDLSSMVIGDDYDAEVA